MENDLYYLYIFGTEYGFRKDNMVFHLLEETHGNK